jgi:hypothetical protein
LASVAFKVSALVSLRYGQQMLANFLGVLPILIPPLCVEHAFLMGGENWFMGGKIIHFV